MRRRIRQANRFSFVNVLKNAIEAMEHGGDVIIKVRTESDSKVWIQFIDNGAGIPADRMQKLGEPFYTSKEKGSGLGLMVSYKIIETHQGTIHIQSKLGDGTTVTIELPVNDNIAAI